MDEVNEKRENKVSAMLSRMAAQGALAFGRFPAAGLLAVANIGVSAFALYSGSRIDPSLAMFSASALGIVLSVGLGLLAEHFTVKRGTALVMQLSVVGLAVAMA